VYSNTVIVITLHCRSHATLSKLDTWKFFIIIF